MVKEYLLLLELCIEKESTFNVYQEWCKNLPAKKERNIFTFNSYLRRYVLELGKGTLLKGENFEEKNLNSCGQLKVGSNFNVWLVKDEKFF